MKKNIIIHRILLTIALTVALPGAMSAIGTQDTEIYPNSTDTLISGQAPESVTTNLVPKIFGVLSLTIVALAGLNWLHTYALDKCKTDSNNQSNNQQNTALEVKKWFAEFCAKNLIMI